MYDMCHSSIFTPKYPFYPPSRQFYTLLKIVDKIDSTSLISFVIVHLHSNTLVKMIVSTSLIISLVEITSSACHVRTDNRLTLLKTTRYSVVTYVRRSMFSFFVFVCLLNTGCGTFQFEETGDQSVEQWID